MRSEIHQFIVRMLAAGGLMLSVQGANAQQAPHPWDGWYGGGVLGISWTDVEVSAPPSNASSDYNGFLGGGILGNNLFVTEQGLVGFETDLIFNDVGGDVAFARHRLSLVTRGGVFVTPSTLLFGVAGLAGGQYKAKVSTNVTTQVTFDNDGEFDVVTTVTPVNGSRDKRLWGYTIGAGIEQAGTFAGLPVRWGIEYRITDFGEWNFSISGQSFTIDPQVQDLRFRAVFPF